MCAVDLTGWNFSNKNLSNSSFSWAKLANVDFSQAILFGSNLSSANMTNSNLSHTNLSNANFNYAEVENANLFCADARGAINLNLSDAITTNTILPDGSIQGLDLSGTVVLTVRDYDGDPIGYTDGVPIVPPHGPIPITVQTSLNMGTDGKLQMQFGDNAWDSTISFQAGIPVALGGTLDLAFAPGISSKSQLGQTLRLFNWTGVSPTGVFNVTSSYNWDLSKLYTSGDVTMLYDPTLANTRWTGAKNGNWNDTGNWTAGVPATGSIIEFNASAPTHQPVIQNISNPLSLNGIGFAPNAGTHILGGPTIQLAGDQPGIACASASDQYINNALELTSDTGFIVSGSGNLILGGNIFGSGSLIKIGSGVLILENSATYQGDTDIQAGILALDATGQIENSAVMNDATFKILSGDHTVGAITGAGETQVVSGSLAVDSLVQKMY
jgi:autotransporter-associated beta strand protein